MNRYPGNHMDSGIVTVPRQLKTRPGAPQTHLAYITGDEAKMIQEHKPGTPHKGPHDLPNYDSWAWDSSGNITESGSGEDWSGGTAWSNTGGSEGTGGSTGDASSEEVWAHSGGEQPDTYIHHDDYYTDPLPEDIIYDDKIADYSFSTPDVRSSVMDKIAFRERIAEGGGSGWAQKTNSEMLAEAMYNLTNNPSYLTQPIFIPEDADWGKIKAAYDEASKTGNNEIFFSVVDDYNDITHGNPNTQYFDDVSGTGWDDWWRRPIVPPGGDNNPGGGGRGYNWGRSNLNYGNRSGYRKYANWGNRPFIEQDFGAGDMQQYYASLKNPGQPRNQEMFENMMANIYRV